MPLGPGKHTDPRAGPVRLQGQKDHTLSAPSLQNVPAEFSFESDQMALGARFAAASATGSAASAIAAIAAAQAARDAAEPPVEIATFLDELGTLISTPITVYQREKLTAALMQAIDARINIVLGY
jgi:hypothetical protein